jgi:hypothetical protein
LDTPSFQKQYCCSTDRTRSGTTRRGAIEGGGGWGRRVRRRRRPTTTHHIPIDDYHSTRLSSHNTTHVHPQNRNKSPPRYTLDTFGYDRSGGSSAHARTPQNMFPYACFLVGSWPQYFSINVSRLPRHGIQLSNDQAPSDRVARPWVHKGYLIAPAR